MIRTLQRLVAVVVMLVISLPIMAVFLPGDLKALSAEQRSVLSSGALHFDVSSDCVEPQSGNRNNIYVLGDSLTVGMKEKGALQEKLEQKGWQNVTIQATNGYNIADSLAKVDEDTAKVSQAGTIVVALGTNRDADFQARLIELINKLKTMAPDATIYWLNVYTPDGPYLDGGVAENNRVNRIIEEQSAELGFNVIDWETEATANPNLYPFLGDNVHHTERGYEGKAQFLADTLGQPGGSASNTGATSQNGCACGANGTGTLVGADNEEKVFNYLSAGKGITGIQAAGIMGNMVAESNYNPTATNPDGGAFGIVQWLAGRKTTLLLAANQAGIDVTKNDDANLKFQLDFMIQESRLRKMRDDPNTFEWDGLARTTSIDGPKETGSTLFWEWNFERSEGTTNGPRVQAALAVAAKFGVQPGGSTSGVSTSVSANISCPGSSEVCEGNAHVPLPETTEITWFNRSNHHQSISFPGGSDDHRPVLRKSNAFGIPTVSGSDSPLGEAADVGSPPGTRVFSPLDGKVKYAGAIIDGESDKMVIIESNNDGKCVATLAHLRPTVQVGDEVTAGQEIGTLTDMGYESHLHFELWVDGVPINIGLDDSPCALNQEGCDSFSDEAEQIWDKQKGALVGAGNAAAAM